MSNSISNSLSASIRRQIIQFDPGLPDSVSISQFCKQLGVSRPSYYKVKERYVAEGNKALNPHSRAPKTTRSLYGEKTVKGHELLPTSGQVICPLVAIKNARIWP